MVWLTGLGNSAQIFREIAGHFAPEHHVFALTRRGHGQSAFPEDGRCNPQVLAEDLLRFLDHHGLQDVVLIGHSIAGNEMTLAAGMQPERFRALVYVDAAHDRSGVLDRMAADPASQQQSPKKQPRTVDGFREDLKAQYGFWNEALDLDLLDMLVFEEDRWRLKNVPDLLRATHSHTPDYGRVSCPALAVYAMFEGTGGVNPGGFWDGVMLPWQTHSIHQFVAGCRLGQVVKWWGTHHYFFLSDMERTILYIQDFLRDISTDS